MSQRFASPFRSRTIRACCLGLAAFAATVGVAASVPAWLDEGISRWNAEHADTPIRFVDIKDSYVWYDIPKTSPADQVRIREGVANIVLANGYEPMDDEDLVTTGTPPVASGRVKPKKCWRSSYVLNIQAQSQTKAVEEDRAGQRQRMLTSLVCEDTATWWAAFRVAQ
jgi:hypothetical protein